MLSEFSPGGTLPPPPPGHDQRKIPRADRVKDTAIKRMTVLLNSLRKDYWKQTKLKNYLCEKFSSAEKKKKWRMTNQKFISNTMLWRKSFWKFIQDIFAWTFPLLCLYWLLVMDFCILGLRLRFLFIGLHMFKFFKHHCYWMLVFLSWLACEAVEAI